MWNPDLSANSGQPPQRQGLRKGAFCHAQRQFRTAMDLSHLPYIRPSCRAAVLRSPAAALVRPAQVPGKIWSSGCGSPVGLRRTGTGKGRARRLRRAARHRLARRADRMGETIALVWCWHGPIPPPRAVILNQATPIRADVFEKVETTGEGPAGRSCAYVSARPEGVSACNYSRLRDRFG